MCNLNWTVREMGKNGYVHELSISAMDLRKWFLHDRLFYNCIRMKIYCDFIHILVGMLVIWIMSLALFSLVYFNLAKATCLNFWLCSLHNINQEQIWVSQHVTQLTATASLVTSESTRVGSNCWASSSHVADLTEVFLKV